MISYPLDTAYLLRRKKQLKTELLQARQDWVEKRIAILCGSTAQEIQDMLELFLLAEGVKPTFRIGEYNRHYEEAVFGSDALDAFDPEMVYLHMTSHNLPDSDYASHLSAIWDGLHERYGCEILQNNFEPALLSPLGHLDVEQGRQARIQQANQWLYSASAERPYLHIHDLAGFVSRIGLLQSFDAAAWYSYKYAIAPVHIPAFSWSLSRLTLALLGKSKKCLVLDADHTLWGGVIGDDGVDGIHIGEGHPVAESYKAFQAYLKTLQERGVILSIVSKNEPETLRAGLHHPESVLNEADFSCIIANWEDKASNIRQLAATLNIGLDSLVFVDDNPAERELVRQALPEVAVPEIGEDAAHYAHVLDQAAYFEPVTISDTDRKRTEQYRANARRAEAAEQAVDYDSYLQSLQMRARILRLDETAIARVTQLINKTNQFNLTNERLNRSEVEAYMSGGNKLALYAHLEDKFGDNGIVSALLCTLSGSEAQLDNWVMSCRVFKRRLEHAMLDELVQHLKDHGIASLSASYKPTEKNQVIKKLLPSLGFLEDSMTSETEFRYSLNMDRYHMHKPPIEVSNA